MFIENDEKSVCKGISIQIKLKINT